MKNYLLILFLFLFQTVAFTQTARIADFQIQPNNSADKVLVLWTLRAGSTCPNLIVERSVNDINFEEVYIYPSVCGSSDSAASYSWVDPSPVPFAKNYYRLKLDGIEFTPSILFQNQSLLSDEKIIVFPNPSQREVTVTFRNSNQLLFDFKLYDSSGKLVRLEQNLRGSSFKFEQFNLPNDFYTIQIILSDETMYTNHIQFIE